MHTLKIILTGIGLLALCLFIARLIGTSKGIATAALIFIPLWLLGAGVNMYVGIRSAGYSLADELPVFVVVFTVPALLALGIWWKLR